MCTEDNSTRRGFLAKGAAAAAVGSIVSGGALAPAPGEVDLIVHSGRLYTMTPERTIYPNGAVAIRGSNIVAVGPSDAIRAQYTAQKSIDASGHLVTPGFVDTHLHPALSFYTPQPPQKDSSFSFGGDFLAFDKNKSMSGVSSNAGFPEFARFMGMTGLVDKLPPVMSYAFSLYSMLVAIRGGATTFVEGGAGDVSGVAEAARHIGMRAGVAQSILDLAVSDPSDGLQRVRDTDQALSAAEEKFQQWNGVDDGMISAWYNAITDVTASNELLEGLAALSKRDNVPVTSHTAATKFQEEYSKAVFGKSGVARVAESGVMDVHWLGIHMGFFTDSDLELLLTHNAHIAHCPGTTSFGGKGIIRDKVLMNGMLRGVPVGIGTDTIFNGNMFQQAKLAIAGHKEAYGDNRILPPYKMLELATVDAAKCANLEGVAGQLKAGMKADLILIDVDTPELARGPEALGMLFSMGSPDNIRTSIINGRIVMQDRVFAMLDEEAVVRDMRTSSAYLAQFAQGQ